MGLLRTKKVLLGLSAVLVAGSSLFADSFVDGQFDNNRNDFDYYWYYYDDNAGVGKNDRPQAAPSSTPSVVNVPSTDSVRKAFGDASDTYVIKKYTFVTGGPADDKCATMPFTFGEKWKTSWDEPNLQEKSFVGIGTQLCKEGSKIDLTGATAVKFRIKASKASLKVRFKIQTKEIDDISMVPGAQLKGDEFGYYGTVVTAPTGDWSTVIVEISSLELPGTWARAIDFNITSATKLAWEIEKKANTTTTTDTLWIDDVEIVGYTFKNPRIWYPTEPLSPMPTQGLFTNFDVAPYNEAKLTLNYKLTSYWYAYNDAEIGGSSKVAEANAYEDPETKRLTLKWNEGTGPGEAGIAALIEYTLGPSVKQNDNDVQGFVGLGINVYDSLQSKYWNASAEGATGVYFHYATIGDLDRVTFEVSDVNDVADADNPTRKDTRGSGVVWYRDLPSTNGEWKAVKIPFDSLVYHDDWSGSKNIPLDKTKLAKLQWKVQGGEGKGGTLAIDNIHFVGWPTRVINTIRTAHNAAFKPTYTNGNIRINWTNNKAVAAGTFSLVNTQGVVISTASVTAARELVVDLPALKIPAGMYFIRMNGTDVSGKTITTQTPITIVK